MSSNNSNDTTPTSQLPPSVLICTFVSSLLSIVGAVVIFITYSLVTVARNQTRRLLVYLTIADLMTAVGNLVGASRYVYIYVIKNETEYLFNRQMQNVTTDAVCDVQSFVTTFSSLSSFFWTSIIMIHILMTLITQREWSSLRNRVIYHFVSWGVPLGITFLALSYDVLGEDFLTSTGPWCWIKGCLLQPKVFLWMALTGKGWEILTYFLTMAFYIMMKIYMWKRRLRFKDRSHHHLREEDELYIMIFFVIIILRAAGTIRFLYAIENTNNSPGTFDKVLLHIQSFGDSAQAFANCILFCIRDTAVRQDMWNRIRGMCRPVRDEEPLLAVTC
ncbi:G-protein coupled receptor 157-like isoform X3 [Magallana gigas]|uniref:G-protein coupled receptor 157-like isoform X3 n=1 Tax=Magallana gigas TaxID=29159 RepID=UPI0033427D4D